MSGGQLMIVACFITTSLLLLAAVSLMLLCNDKFMSVNFLRSRGFCFALCRLISQCWILAPITSALIQFGNKFIFHHAIVMVLFCSSQESTAIAELCPLARPYLARTWSNIHFQRWQPGALFILLFQGQDRVCLATYLRLLALGNAKYRFKGFTP